MDAAGEDGGIWKFYSGSFPALCDHPNVGGVVLIGLGCEVSNTKSLLPLINEAGKPIEVFNVQEDGGSLATARKGADAARRILSEIKGQPRVPFPGINCWWPWNAAVRMPCPA